MSEPISGEALATLIRRAHNSKREFGRLLTALGACPRRQRFADLNLNGAWRKAKGSDLYWYLRRLASRGVGHPSLDAMVIAVYEVVSTSGSPAANAAVLRSWFTTEGRVIRSRRVTVGPIGSL